MSFSRRQLTLQQPRLILCLGLRAAAFLSLASPQLQAWSWRKFSKIDAAGAGLVRDVHFTGCLPAVSAVALLTHPSYRSLNSKLRKYGDLCGDDAEFALLREALDYIGGSHDLGA